MSGRAGAVAGWVTGAALAGFVAGPWVAAAAAVVATVVLAGWVGARALGWAAVGMMALSPMVWLTANWTRLGTVSPDLVTQSPWPSRLVAASLVVATGALAARRLGSEVPAGEGVPDAGSPGSHPARKRAGSKEETTDE